MAKIIYKSPLFPVSELLEQIKQADVQLELVRAVQPNGDLSGYMDWLMFISDEEFEEIAANHKCVLDEYNECPVEVIKYRRIDRATSIQQLPSGVEEPKADVVVKGIACPECHAPLREHQVTGVRYCGRCDWSSLVCHHVPEEVEVWLAHGREIFIRCAFCGKDYLNGKWI